ncbi:hypothetical protein FB45DRAFT_915447 [Roridomyces roridus]|uniref:Uncharacterized protein n=1 Tax=Roridomyces roridus TaxID=1738132 RepID=A0AAD7BTT9_9AGAR|nr:hypothetical protein FB45DRAFT_915447 [Roridomyces roridus]
MPDEANRPRTYRPYPWPWAQSSILQPTTEKSTSWMDVDFDSDGDYSSDDGEDSSDDGDDSDSGPSSSDHHISDSEIAVVTLDRFKWRSGPRLTRFQQGQEQVEDLPRQIAELVKAEQDCAAEYDPDQVVSLITQLYELLAAMGQWSEDSIRYPPHLDPPVNEELATQLGYTSSAIDLMKRLPFIVHEANDFDHTYIIGRTRCADYTDEGDLEEGRHPYPYQYLDGCPKLDPWLLPLMLPTRDGFQVILDTKLGVVRAFSSESGRHGDVPDDELEWTDYRRAPLVRAADYFSEVIYAYRSLSRLPVIHADLNDPLEKRHVTLQAADKQQQDTLMALYRECGWPNEWRRDEFLEKWEAARAEIASRARAASKRRRR